MVVAGLIGGLTLSLTLGFALLFALTLNITVEQTEIQGDGSLNDEVRQEGEESHGGIGKSEVKRGDNSSKEKHPNQSQKQLRPGKQISIEFLSQR